MGCRLHYVAWLFLLWIGGSTSCSAKRLQIKEIPRDFTQQALADKVSLTRTSITNIERGRQHIQLHTLYSLAKALEVEVVDLLPARKSVEGSVAMTLSKEGWLNTL